MIHFLSIGILLGLSAGFAPGPLLTLVVLETLQYDIKSGIMVAVSPLVTDLPIILLTLYFLSELSSYNTLLGMLSMAGSVFILFVGHQSLRTTGIKFNLQQEKPKSLLKGIVTNALSPHPYLFWFTVGTPIMVKAKNLNLLALLAFIISFYVMLVGSKILLAIMVGRSKSFLSGHMYLYTMRFLGLLLCILACILFVDGLKLLGIINT